MCCANGLDGRPGGGERPGATWVPIDRAAIGVFAYVTRAGTPNACAVTPYVVDGAVVVTSTPALVAKAAAVRRDPRVALLAGGTEVRGAGAVAVDLTPGWFDEHLRDQERRKYPPARSLLTVPGHRHLFAWYVGRAVVRLTEPTVRGRPGDDGVTVTVLDDAGTLSIRPLEGEVRTAARRAGPGDELVVGDGPPDGSAVLLVHEEDPTMVDLRQLVLDGVVRDGVLTVAHRRGSLEPGPTGLVSQLRSTRSLARRARANRERLADWPTLVAAGAGR